MDNRTNESTVYEGGQFLTFRLEQEMYGVPIRTVLEVLDYLPVTKLPGSKNILKGVINLRGAVVPVADIRIKFGMSPTVQTKNTCIIVVNVFASGKGGQTTVGVLADQVMEVADIASSDIQQPPDMGTGIPAHYLHGIGKLGENFFMMLDVDAIIRDDMHMFTTTGAPV
jgi:purine-binding chemotaxis protein CheW